MVGRGPVVGTPPLASLHPQYECWPGEPSMLLKAVTWTKDLVVWSWTYLWAIWFILVRPNNLDELNVVL